MIPRKLKLSVLTGRFAVCRLAADAEIPEWARRGAFFSITRTAEELSIVCPEESVPADVRAERGWRCFKLLGPFAFNEVGVLAAITRPVADGGISLFAVSTFDTDYVLVKAPDFERALNALGAAGHTVSS
jgi:uncharacterized protein